MATYYIDPSAGSNGSGTINSPYNVLPTLSGSNTYLLKRGTTLSGYATPSTGGSAGNPLIVGAYGTGPRPIVLGQDNGWSLSSKTYIRLENLDIRAASRSSDGVIQLSADATTASGIEVVNCRVSGGRIGIRIRGTGNTVDGNEVTNCGQDAMYMEVADTTITNNVMTYFDQDGTNVGDGIQFAGVHNHGTCVVSGNYIDGRNSNGSVKQCIVTGLGTATSFVIEGNELYGMNQCLDVGITGAQIKRNLCHSPVGSGRAITVNANNIAVISNIAFNCVRAVTVGAFTGVTVYGNTFNEVDEGIIVNTAGGEVTAKNNLIKMKTSATGNALLVVSTATLVANFNAYSDGAQFSWNNTTYTAFQAFKAATSQEASGTYLNFDIYPDNKPRSPRVHSGADNLGGTDYYGNTFPASPSFGAIQCVGVFPRGMLTDYESVGDKESFIRGRGRRR